MKYNANGDRVKILHAMTMFIVFNLKRIMISNYVETVLLNSLVKEKIYPFYRLCYDKLSLKSKTRKNREGCTQT